MLGSFFSFRPIRLLVPSQRKNTAKTSASPTSSEKEQKNKEQLTSYNMITSKVLPFWRLPTYGCRQIMTSVVDQNQPLTTRTLVEKKETKDHMPPPSIFKE